MTGHRRRGQPSGSTCTSTSLATSGPWPVFQPGVLSSSSTALLAFLSTADYAEQQAASIPLTSTFALRSA
jgi:hypothetical protein